MINAFIKIAILTLQKFCVINIIMKKESKIGHNASVWNKLTEMPYISFASFVYGEYTLNISYNYHLITRKNILCTSSAICRRPCHQGGTCVRPDRCECPDDYYGNFCQYKSGMDSLIYINSDTSDLQSHINICFSFGLRRTQKFLSDPSCILCEWDLVYPTRVICHVSCWFALLNLTTRSDWLAVINVACFLLGFFCLESTVCGIVICYFSLQRIILL